jgi:phosphatidylserine/phosphatidylglycerophosphate/cardiolipin synthase-like enzyme
MIHPGRYTDGTPTPGGQSHDIAAGEPTILEQYGRAIAAARSSIYIENQALPVPAIARRLEQALQRGVEVVLVVPAEPEGHVRAARLDPARAEPFAWIEALGRHPAFTLAGLYCADEKGPRAVYVHAKAMLVDDAWATAGSCNLHYNSLNGHSEMNVSLWDGGAVRALRCELMKEHLGQDTGMLDDRAALRRFRRIAIENRQRLMRGETALSGLAVALEPADYARARPASIC